jgi:hypothetical protein
MGSPSRAVEKIQGREIACILPDGPRQVGGIFLMLAFIFFLCS